MSDFDPYLKWLGIRESVRPINHYRLLGLDLFESDPEVISMAADRQMAHVRTYQNGPQGERSQQLLNELARARRCLLVKEQKEAYDQELRLGQVRVAAEEPSNQALPVASAIPVVESASESTGPAGIKISSDPDARRRAQGREKKQMIWGLLGWLAGGVAAVGLSAFLISAGIIPWGDQSNDDPKPVALLSNDKDDDPADNVPPKATPSKPQAKQGDTTSNDPDKNSASTGSKPTEPANNDDNDPATPSDSTDAGPMFPLEPIGDAVMLNGPMLPPATEYSLGNSSEYPNVEAAIGLMKSCFAEIEAGTAVQSRGSNQLPAQTNFEDAPREPSLVIGARVWVDRQSLVTGLQPIYLKQDGVSPGPRRGNFTRYSVDLIAKPGYAVASVSLSPTFPMRSIAFNFAKITNRGLDLNDQYSSDRVGARQGVYLTIAPETSGSPILGFYMGTLPINDSPQISSLRLLTIGQGFNQLAINELLPNRDNDGTPTPMTNDPFAPGAETSSDPNGETVVDTRTDLPNSLDLENAKQSIEELYKRDFDRLARMSARQRNREVERVIDRMVAEVPQRNVAERYVVHDQAILMSASIGDITRAMRSLDALNEEFKIDYWTAVQETLNSTAGNVSSSEQLTFKETIDRLIATAVEKGEFKKGEELIEGAAKIATSMRVTTLKAWYKMLADELDELNKLKVGYEKAKDTLTSLPDDAKANQAIGDYAFIHQDLDTALKYWDRSKASNVAKLVQLENETDRSDAKQMLDLSAAWQRFGKGRHSLKRSKALRRSLDLYGQTIRLLEGSKREKAQAEYDELEQQLANLTPVDRLFE